MSALQTIIEKGYINDVIELEDNPLIRIELKSSELSSDEQNTLISINLEHNPVGLDVFVYLYKEGIVNNVCRFATGNWCLEIDKTELSDDDLSELMSCAQQNRPIGNTEENRNLIASKLPHCFKNK
ncbi:MAG: hypothetical protein IJK78_00810 [Bacteroidales bacterium]|nr:hypothetical protein [Bacteroidales bacterium]